MNEYIPFAGPSNFSGTTENVALIDIMPLAELRRIYKDIKIVKYKTELVIGEKTPNKTLNKTKFTSCTSYFINYNTTENISK